MILSVLFRRRAYSACLVSRLIIIRLDGMGADFLGKRERKHFLPAFELPSYHFHQAQDLNSNPYASIRFQSFTEHGRRVYLVDEGLNLCFSSLAIGGEAPNTLTMLSP